MSIFVFEADFSGAKAYVGGGGRVPKGVYAVTYNDASVHDRAKNGCTTVWMDFTAVDGSAVQGVGGNIREFVRLPDSNLPDTGARDKANEHAVAAFKGILISHGVPKDKLESKLRLTEENLKNKIGYMEYTPKDESTGQAQDDRKWLTKAAYEAKLKALRAAEEPTDVDTSGVEPETPVTTTASGKTITKKKVVKEDDDIKPLDVSNVDASDPLEFANI